MKRAAGAAALALAFVLAGCKSAPGLDGANGRCPAESRMQQTTLYFGLSQPDGTVITPAQWQAFVDGDVTPRFRAGLTVFDARGQWLGNDGGVVREQSKALMLIHANDARQNAEIEAIRQRYVSRFHQESVMRVDLPACVQF